MDYRNARDDILQRHRSSCRLAWISATVLTVAAFTPTAQSQTITTCVYLGGTEDWTTVTAWNGGACDSSFPNGSNFDASIDTGTVNLDQDISINALSLRGGRITGINDLDLASESVWSAGDMAGSGSTTFRGDLLITGDTDQELQDSRVVNTAGTTTWSGNTQDGGNEIIVRGGTFNNTGTWEDRNDFDATIFATGLSSTPRAFDNAGSYRKLGESTTEIRVPFNNTGTVSVEAGTLALSGPVTQHVGNELTGGTWRVEDNSSLVLGGDDIVTNRGHVTLEGPGSSFERINTLATNTGTFRLTEGRVFDTDGAFSNSGTVHVAAPGSLLDVAGDYTQTAGTTDLDQGGALRVASGSVIDIQGGSLTGEGGLTGDVRIGTGALLSAGSSPGLLEIDGDLDFTGSWLAELAGTDPSVPEYDRVSVSGIATIDSGSSIDVALIDGFDPMLGDTFDILTASTIDVDTNAFGSIFSLPSLDGSLGLDVTLVGDTTDILRLSVIGLGTAGTLDAVWNGGTGSYTDGGNWSFSDAPVAATFPSNDADNTFNVFIDGGDTGTASDASLAGTATIDSLAIDAGDRLTVQDGAALTAVRDASRGASGRIDNAGTLALAGGEISADRLANAATGELAGHGTVDAATSNEGLIRANGGTLSLTQGASGPEGVLRTDPGSRLVLGAESSTGVLDHNATAADGLDLTGGSITVHRDYRNAGFGEGNAFDARANVTGGGEILAAGDTTQEITGEVSGGETASPTLDFGNLRVGDSLTRTYRISNGGTSGPDLRGALQDDANGALIDDARLSGSGVTAMSFGPLAPGESTGDLDVTFDAASAGALTGQRLHVENNFDNVTDQDLQITGAAFRVAQPGISPESVTLNARVGDVASQALTIRNDAPADGFSESLAVTGTTASGEATVGGSVAGLIAAGESNAGLQVGLDTSAAGARSGTVLIDLASDGTGTSGLAALDLGAASVSVAGNVYTPAEAELVTSAIDFGIVHVGDSVDSEALEISNAAPNTALNDVLRGTFGDAGGPFTAAGDLGSGLAPGETDASSLVATLDTTRAGVFNDAGLVSLVSHNEDLADLALPSETISLNAQVNEFANPSFELLSGDGSLGLTGSDFLLDFGTVEQDSGPFEAFLGLRNDIPDPADSLAGLFDTTAAGAFDLFGFDAFGIDADGTLDPSSALDPGELLSELRISFDSGLAPGTYQGSLLFNGIGFNGSGFRGDLAPLALDFSVQVVEERARVPLPGTLLLLLPFGLGLLWRHRSGQAMRGGDAWR